MNVRSTASERRTAASPVEDQSTLYTIHAHWNILSFLLIFCSFILPSIDKYNKLTSVVFVHNIERVGFFFVCGICPVAFPCMAFYVLLCCRCFWECRIKNQTNRGKYIEVGRRQYVTMVIFLQSRNHWQISRVAVSLRFIYGSVRPLREKRSFV